MHERVTILFLHSTWICYVVNELTCALQPKKNVHGRLISSISDALLTETMAYILMPMNSPELSWLRCYYCHTIRDVISGSKTASWISNIPSHLATANNVASVCRITYPAGQTYYGHRQKMPQKCWFMFHCNWLDYCNAILVRIHRHFVSTTAFGTECNRKVHNAHRWSYPF